MLFQAPEAALSATATPVFESILLLAFKRALAAYCAQVRQLPERIRVTVGTAEPVAASVRARFHIVARGLVGSHRVGVVFEVPTPSGRRTLIRTDVFYTRATNRLAKVWQSWHVKVYRCATPGDADTLRQYLRRQAIDIQAANADLEGPARTPVEPPWAVVPVQVVRGDGHHDSLDGSVLTELAAPPAELMHRVGQELPAWFEEAVPSPELYVLAVSPHVEQIRWSPFLARPATEELADFAGMAAGLDALHRLGMAHCDIKPDNT